MVRKRFPHHRPLGVGNPVNSPHKGSVMRTFVVFFLSPNKLLNQLSIFQWFEAQWRSYDAIVKKHVIVIRWKYRLVQYDKICATISKVSCFRSTLQWRHNDYDSVSNHQPHGCLLNRLFRRRSKQTSKLRVTGLCVGNSPGPVNSPHKGPVTRKTFPFDDIIM